jgi:hypothetical protein
LQLVWRPKRGGTPPPSTDGPEFRQVRSGAPEFYVMAGSVKEGFEALCRRPDLEFKAWIRFPDGRDQLHAIPRKGVTP